MGFFDPVRITSGLSGRTSVSSLQVFGFSVIIATMLAYALGRYGSLSDLSPSLLALLGISAGGAGAAKLTHRLRHGPTRENLAWLKEKEWPTKADNKPWARLLVFQGEFDISRFQVLAFSLVVAIAIVLQGTQSLATFAIPETLLGLLGLSQAAYTGGIAVTTPIKEYNDLLVKTRAAEEKLLKVVLGANVPEAERKPFEVAAAKHASIEYQEYMSLVNSAAAMHEDILGQPVPEDKRAPERPAAFT